MTWLIDINAFASFSYSSLIFHIEFGESVVWQGQINALHCVFVFARALITKIASNSKTQFHQLYNFRIANEIVEKSFGHP